jgi:hypothetical protein
MIRLGSQDSSSICTIKILKSSDFMYWYNNQIGNTFNAYHENFDCYWVRDMDGYRNTVLKADCEVCDAPS